MKRNLIILAMIVFIDMAGIGLIMPVMPSLIQDLTGEGLDRAAEFGGWLLFSYALMQFLFAPVIGGLSDRFGRRPVLLTTLALLGADYALMAWAPSLAWLFVGRIVSGIMGASWAAANSCIADSITPERRGAAFGILGGAGATGFVIGPAIGGLIGQYGDRLPFLAAMLMCFVGAAIGLAAFGETLPKNKRRPFVFKRANPFGSILQISKAPLVSGLIGVIFFMQLGSQSQVSVWAYYGTAKFGWSPFVIGATIALYGAMLAFVQAVLAGWSIRRFGADRTAKVGLSFAIPSFFILAFAPNLIFVVVGMAIGSLAGMCSPALQQLMTQRIPDDSQGELQGAIASTISFTSIIGPPIMTAVFAVYADTEGVFLPGAPFVLSALLMAGASMILVLTLQRYSRS